ncbi:hypothetical protein M5J20_01065 [Corynebacterium sp. TA-R-1]|uniref:Uncharacterized protein n=1 Tax=Corynebacterium stercoris TaxID=2943490 RepID=A0ABT1G1E8_9CORY|nr:hypothetical protein [Corynebacterium stercoris]MCP1386793.1 hypothetical protein [Corynebacterium stercoris]
MSQLLLGLSANAVWYSISNLFSGIWRGVRDFGYEQTQDFLKSIFKR